MIVGLGKAGSTGPAVAGCDMAGFGGAVGVGAVVYQGADGFELSRAGGAEEREVFVKSRDYKLIDCPFANPARQAYRKI